MRSTCIDDDELARFSDGEASETRAAAIRSHAAACGTCRAALERQRGLLDDLRAPVADAPIAPLVAAVLERLDRPAAARPARWFGAAGVIAAAAAGIALVWIAGRTDHADRPGHEAAGELTARGGSAGGALGRQVGVTVYTLATDARPLAAGSTIAPDTALMLGYRNLNLAAPIYLLVFAVDAAGAVHWLVPGYLDPARDPEAIELTATTRETALPESVVLDQPAPGRLRIVSVASRSRLRVSAIEGQPAPALDVAALRARWPGAAISELIVDVASRGPNR